MLSKQTTIIAHRSGAGLWPENSLYAIKNALDLEVNGEKLDGIEIDVHFSADHQVYVFHDEDLERCSDGVGKINQMRQKELSKLVLQKEGMADAGPIPSFDNYLGMMKKNHGLLSIELKDKNGGEAYPYLVKVILEKLKKEHLSERAFLHAFNWSYLAELMSIDPTIACAANIKAEHIDKYGSLENILDYLKTIGVYEINIDHRLMNKESIQNTQKKGFRVTVWTVNLEKDLKFFIDTGVDSISTDYPDRALEARQTFYSRSVLG